MIKGMPKHAQTAIQNYLDTGNFKDHVNGETFQNAQENKDTIANFRKNIDEFISADNDPDLDLDPRDGYIRMEGFFDITGRHETAADGTKEAFQDFGGAIMYFRDSGDALDIIATSDNPSHDEGVQHYDAKDHTKSFMSIAPEDQ